MSDTAPLVEWPTRLGHHHQWANNNHTNPHTGQCGCYFCDASNYPPMWPGHTLCGCCGALIHTATNDPWNEAIILCHPCNQWAKQEHA